MKKIFATLITLCLCFGCSTVYAFSPDDLTAREDAEVQTSKMYDLTETDFDYVSNMVKTYCLKQNQQNNTKPSVSKTGRIKVTTGSKHSASTGLQRLFRV